LLGIAQILSETEAGIKATMKRRANIDNDLKLTALLAAHFVCRVRV
jgi:hypothetical protein